ncbi:hypothetical protein AB0I28_02230 [Phytomonospora sp. NPDC050363]|uniref:hypothetical protein n=1 Tax=Phytomonospora sp. NPDC050363 TaxID=3155642 RepID=UPI0033DD554D
MAKVSVDLGNGTATVAGRAIAVGEHPDGLRLHGPDGPVLRSLSFGERRFAVRAAEGCPDPADALARSVGRLALGEETADAAVEALALFLAGAREETGTGPGLAEAALAVVRATGWTATELDAAVATSVDELAGGLIPPSLDADDGWTSLRLAPASVAEIRNDLAADLLSRAARRPAAEAFSTVGRTDSPTPPEAASDASAGAKDPGAGSGAHVSGPTAGAPPAVGDPYAQDPPGTRQHTRAADPGPPWPASPSAAGDRPPSRGVNGTSPRQPTPPAPRHTANGEPRFGGANGTRGPRAAAPNTNHGPGAAPRARPEPIVPRGPYSFGAPGAAHRPHSTPRRPLPPPPAPGTWSPITRPPTPEQAGTLITGPWAPLAEQPPTPFDPGAPAHRAPGDPILRLVTEDEDLAERLARVLHDEADLRGMAP